MSPFACNGKGGNEIKGNKHVYGASVPELMSVVFGNNNL